MKLKNPAQQVIDLACRIQQIPSPTFYERERAQFIQRIFNQEDLVDVSVDELGNVFGRKPGSGSGRPIVISAHLDTVFPVDTDLTLQKDGDTISGPGIGDNSIGVASLLGILWQLKGRRADLSGDCWFVANVCEEGLGNLRGMQNVVERFGALPRTYLILEGMGLGEVFHRGLGVRRYRVSIQTAGGHSWIDFGQPSAIHELCKLAYQITNIVPPSNPRTTYNIGTIRGGTSVNTLASTAEFELDLRSEEASALNHMINQVELLFSRTQNIKVQCDAKIIGERPYGEIPASHPIVRLAIDSLVEEGVFNGLGIGSTDANIPLSKGYPAVCMGVTHGSGAHTLSESIQFAPIIQGLNSLSSFVIKSDELH